LSARRSACDLPAFTCSTMSAAPLLLAAAGGGEFHRWRRRLPGGLAVCSHRECSELLLLPTALSGGAGGGLVRSWQVRPVVIGCRFGLPCSRRSGP
jgi:hypothetical protein